MPAPFSVRLLHIITRVHGKRRFSSRRVARPSISGISISRVTTSGHSCGTRCKAIAPLEAVPTTSISGSPRKASDKSLRMTTESSTTSTRMGRAGVDLGICAFNIRGRRRLDRLGLLPQYAQEAQLVGDHLFG